LPLDKFLKSILSLHYLIKCNDHYYMIIARYFYEFAHERVRCQSIYLEYRDLESFLLNCNLFVKLNMFND